ncbi:hypothetical protein ACLESO_16160 [Pyxidicoccus sp. 3LG]
MQLKWTGCLLVTALVGLAGCQGEPTADGNEPSLGSQTAKAEEPCIEGQNSIINCATGAAKLERSDKGITVTGLEDPKRDGVSSKFEPAVRWSQTASVEEFGGAALAARDGDQVVSTLRVERGEDERTIALSPGFTGSPDAQYTVNVYLGGQLQYASPYYYPIYHPIYIRWWWPWWRWPRFYWGFYQVWPWWYVQGAAHSGMQGAEPPDNVGACVWSLGSDTDAPFTLELDGKEVVGDRIELVETIKDGAYPYNKFTGIDMRGSAKSYTILEESVTRP